MGVWPRSGVLSKSRSLIKRRRPCQLSGRYILQPEIFHELDAKRTGAGGEIQLTDSMARLIGKQGFYGVRYEGTRYDCGDKAGFIEANAAFALAHPEIGPQVRKALKKILE